MRHFSLSDNSRSTDADRRQAAWIAVRAQLQELARSTLQPAELSELLGRASALLERELDVQRPRPAPASAPAIRICALGGFLILRNGSPLPRRRKAPGKPLTLLKALVALGARGVPGDTLADLLWPEAEGDHADARLTTTLHRTRALLGVPGTILKDGGELSLNRELVSCDVLEFHDVLQRIETQQHSARESSSLLLKAYPGPLLPACTGEAWLQPCRERLAARFAGAVARVGRRLEAESNRAEAQTLYLEALAREPLAACLKRFL
jgi:DNA-binding SARP family transcriptional activator